MVLGVQHSFIYLVQSIGKLIEFLQPDIILGLVNGYVSRPDEI